MKSGGGQQGGGQLAPSPAPAAGRLQRWRCATWCTAGRSPTERPSSIRSACQSSWTAPSWPHDWRWDQFDPMPARMIPNALSDPLVWNQSIAARTHCFPPFSFSLSGVPVANSKCEMFQEKAVSRVGAWARVRRGVGAGWQYWKNLLVLPGKLPSTSLCPLTCPQRNVYYPWTYGPVSQQFLSI